MIMYIIRYNLPDSGLRYHYASRTRSQVERALDILFGWIRAYDMHVQRAERVELDTGATYPAERAERVRKLPVVENETNQPR